MGEMRIGQLASIVSSNTAKVERYLKDHGLPSPSFDVDAPADLGIPKDAIEVEVARRAALEATIELQDLLAQFNGTSLQVIYKYQIPFKVPIHGTVSFAELSNQCGIPELDMRRILRFAMAFHRVFCEPQKGLVAHTAASRELAENPRAYDMLGLSFEETWQAQTRTTEAMEKWGDDEPNHTGHALAMNTEDNMFDWLGKHPEQARRFNSTISTLIPTGRPATFLIESFDWASLGKGKIVDVGGSAGGVSILLAEAFLDLRFVVQDLPKAIEGAKDKVPPAVADRIEFMPHDFFTEQPMSGDIYLLRAIFHNWPDTYCVKILRQLVPALKKGARIVINDSIVPDPGTLGLLAERNTRAYDMLMKTLFNARDREEGDWVKFLEQANDGFHVESVKRATIGTIGVSTMVWNGLDT